MKELLEMVLLRDVNLMPISTGEHLRLGEGSVVLVDRKQFQNESLHRVDIFLQDDTSRSRFSLSKSEIATPLEWINKKIEDKFKVSDEVLSFKHPFAIKNAGVFLMRGRIEATKPALNHCVIDSQTGDIVARTSEAEDATIMAYLLSYKNKGRSYVCIEGV